MEHGKTQHDQRYVYALCRSVSLRMQISVLPRRRYSPEQRIVVIVPASYICT